MPQTDSGERRRQSDKDHDTLTEVVTIMSNHVKNFDAHAKNDQENFAMINASIERLSKYVYVGVGIVVAFQAIPILTSVIQTLAHAGTK